MCERYEPSYRARLQPDRQLRLCAQFGQEKGLESQAFSSKNILRPDDYRKLQGPGTKRHKTE